MTNHWILDVLTDLRSFAAANGLTALSEQLEDARLVAAAELSLDEGAAQADTGRNDTSPRCAVGATGARIPS